MEKGGTGGGGRDAMRAESGERREERGGTYSGRVEGDGHGPPARRIHEPGLCSFGIDSVTLIAARPAHGKQGGARKRQREGGRRERGGDRRGGFLRGMLEEGRTLSWRTFLSGEMDQRRRAGHGGRESYIDSLFFPLLLDGLLPLLILGQDLLELGWRERHEPSAFGMALCDFGGTPGEVEKPRGNYASSEKHTVDPWVG